MARSIYTSTQPEARSPGSGLASYRGGDAADTDILSFAAAEDRIVVTLDPTLPQILALTAARCALGDSDSRACVLPRSLQGCVLKLGSRGVRIRLLPLK